MPDRAVGEPRLRRGVAAETSGNDFRWLAEPGNPTGANGTVNNVDDSCAHDERPSGNSAAAYALRKLRRDAPELAEAGLDEVERRAILTHEEAGRLGGRGKALGNTQGFTGGKDTAYTLARLDRDAPELAEARFGFKAAYTRQLRAASAVAAVLWGDRCNCNGMPAKAEGTLRPLTKLLDKRGQNEVAPEQRDRIEAARLIERMVQDDPEALDLLDRACGSRQGERTDLVDNVHEVRHQERPSGNSAARALRKLRRDAPATTPARTGGVLPRQRTRRATALRFPP